MITAIRGPGCLVQLPHHLDPVDPRQHQVEHDQVGAVHGGEPQRLGAVGGAVGLIAGPLHVAADDVEDRRLVVDDQHGALGGVGHRPRLSRLAGRTRG